MRNFSVTPQSLIIFNITWKTFVGPFFIFLQNKFHDEAHKSRRHFSLFLKFHCEFIFSWNLSSWKINICLIFDLRIRQHQKWFIGKSSRWMVRDGWRNAELIDKTRAALEQVVDESKEVGSIVKLWMSEKLFDSKLRINWFKSNFGME